MLYTYELLLDDTLGTRKTNPVDIELQPGDKLYHANLYTVPRVHETVFRKEFERLCRLWVMKKVNI